MKSLRLIIIISISALLFSCETAGLGGTGELTGSVMHHDDTIYGAHIFIKYDAIESPGSDISKYDAMTTLEADGNYQFTGLNKGDYFLYGVGFDSASNDSVFGGIPVSLKKGESFKTDVPVTED